MKLKNCAENLSMNYSRFKEIYGNEINNLRSGNDDFIASYIKNGTKYCENEFKVIVGDVKYYAEKFAKSNGINFEVAKPLISLALWVENPKEREDDNIISIKGVFNRYGYKSCNSKSNAFDDIIENNGEKLALSLFDKYHLKFVANLKDTFDGLRSFLETTQIENFFEVIKNDIPDMPNVKLLCAYIAATILQSVRKINAFLNNIVEAKNGVLNYSSKLYSRNNVGVSDIKADCINVFKQTLRGRSDLYKILTVPQTETVPYSDAGEKFWKILLFTPFFLGGAILTSAISTALVLLADGAAVAGLIGVGGLIGSIILGVNVGCDKGEDIYYNIHKKKEAKINDPIRARQQEIYDLNEKSYKEYCTKFLQNISYEAFDYIIEKSADICSFFKPFEKDLVEILRSDEMDELPEKYIENPEVMLTMAEYFNDKRVETIKEAVNLYVVEEKEKQHREELRQIELQKLLEEKRQTEYQRVRAEYEKEQAERQKQAEQMRAKAMQALFNDIKEIKRESRENEKIRAEQISSLNSELNKRNELLREANNKLENIDIENKRIRKMLENE